MRSSINDWKSFLLIKIKVFSKSYPFFLSSKDNFSSFILLKGFKNLNFFFFFSKASAMFLELIFVFTLLILSFLIELKSFLLRLNSTFLFFDEPFFLYRLK